MSVNVVVVTGSEVADQVGLPMAHGLKTLGHPENIYEKVLSSKNYGNFLPELWAFAKMHALETATIPPSVLHIALAEAGWPIITQNTGGLHKRAGSLDVYEVYGTFFQAKCLRCEAEMPMTADCYKTLEEGAVPACLKCGKERVRPDLALPGEGLKRRRQAEKLLRKATHVVYVGVTPDSEPVSNWYWQKGVPQSILVSKSRWGGFNNCLDMTPFEWAEAGLPLR